MGLNPVHATLIYERRNALNHIRRYKTINPLSPASDVQYREAVRAVFRYQRAKYQYQAAVKSITTVEGL